MSDAPDDAVREMTPAARERDVHRDLRAENERVGHWLPNGLRGGSEWITHHPADRCDLCAALAGERAAREALARVEDAIGGDAAFVRHPDVRHPETCPVCEVVRHVRAALSPTDQDQSAPPLAPPETAEQEPQIPPHEHFYLIGEHRCGFTINAGRCQHTAEQEPAPDSEGARPNPHGWVAPRGGGYQAKATGRPKPPPPTGRGSTSPAARRAADQAIHEAHMTLRYSLRDIANGDTGSLDPKDCPVCNPAAPPAALPDTHPADYRSQTPDES